MIKKGAWSRQRLDNAGSESYDVLESIGNGSSSSVYLARCLRGRLANRHVALKKIDKQKAKHHDFAHLSDSASLHQSLHHPSILSLYSVFVVDATSYHVLELCTRGTLADFIHSAPKHYLSESQTRGVIKNLVDALTYLKKERILHRDIKASNVLVADDYRVKLADFGLAVRLPTSVSTVTTFCGSPNYVAPEVVQRRPYSFPADVWSLGCLLLTCVSGIPPFEAESLNDVFENVTQGAYIVPEHVSEEVIDTIDALLQINPRDRTLLHLILTRPFFHPSRHIQPLDHTAIEDHEPPLKPSPSPLRPYPRLPFQARLSSDPLVRLAHARLGTRHCDYQAQSNGPNYHDIKRYPTPPEDTPEDPRRIVSEPHTQRHLFPSKTVRIASLAHDFANLDIQPKSAKIKRAAHPRPPSYQKPEPESPPPVIKPEPEEPPSLMTALKHYKTTAAKPAPPSPPSSVPHSPPEPVSGPWDHPLSLRTALRRYRTTASRRPSPEPYPEPLVPPHSPPESPEAGPSSAPIRVPRAIGSKPTHPYREIHVLGIDPVRKRPQPEGHDASVPSKPVGTGVRRPLRPRQISSNDEEPAHGADISAVTNLTSLPIGTTRPRRMTTSPLKPQTHRVSHGKLSIRANHDLLIDFREGERRRGKRGDSVLVMSADGSTVCVYHDLPEKGVESLKLGVPSTQCAPEDLSRKYWKTWNDAEKLVEHIKQRTSRMVLYDFKARWTLMANDPYADIEGLFVDLPPSQGRSKPERPVMRIRLSRKRRQLEIARVIRPSSLRVQKSTTGPGPVSGEWTSATLVMHYDQSSGAWTLTDTDVVSLDAEEHHGISQALHFVGVSEGLEDEHGYYRLLDGVA